MQILISDPSLQTMLFATVFGVVFVVTFLKKKQYTSLLLTQELKGFAILIIIFAHIGYYLSSNSQFLFPFSILAGVGVNLFLFLSGYGLTFSQMKRGETIMQFYKRRLLKLFVPFWIVLGVLFIADFFILKEVYSAGYMLKAFFGIFTEANMYTNVDSPLWYFSFILFYYLLFPIFFNKKWPWVTAILLYLSVWLIVQFDPRPFGAVIGLYQVHMLAFPLGVLLAWFGTTKKYLWLAHTCRKKYIPYEKYVYPPLAVMLIGFISYFSIHANVGGPADLEQATSLMLMFAIGLLFLIKKRESKLFSLFGFFSYEVYLFHWPLMYHYDFLYKFLPASVATLLYLGVFIALAFLLQKAVSLVGKKQ